MMVKICGMTNREDALAAIDAGAAALGFNFWPRSPRYLPPEQRDWIRELPQGVLKVGVFVDESAEDVSDLAARLGLDVAQLHGGVLPTEMRVWKAFTVGPEFRPQQLDGIPVEAFLLDAPAGEMRGGAGQSFDWKLAAGAHGKIILAGGLDATNVAAAIRAAEPWGVDACSRLESAPGRKDQAKVAAFIAAALAESRA